MIPKDKIYHFIAGVLIAIMGGIITDPITGIGFAIAAGIFKECWDQYNDRPFDVVDMVVTWLGGLAGLGIVTLIKYFIK